MEIDLSLFRQMLLDSNFKDISSDLEKFDNHICHFFYDESNNIRKLWLTEKDFNAPVNRDFVLGGVMYFGETSNADFSILKNELRLQKSAKEIKFKHISSSQNFLDCLSEPKVNIFLQWLYQSDLYIHYSNINNLYFAIIDIVDDIVEPANISFHFQIKNELYKIFSSHYDEFYQLLIEYNYPNIIPKNIASFYQSIINIIDEQPGELSFYMEVLRQGLKSASKQNDLTFLQGNPEKTIIDNYFRFYLRPIGLFSSAQHIFDNEYQIQEQFNKYKLSHCYTKANNYSFIDSIDSSFIQISDCIVGLLGKYYTYINGIDTPMVDQIFDTITFKQRQALTLLAKIIYKSENYSKLLLHSTESLEENRLSAHILCRALHE